MDAMDFDQAGKLRILRYVHAYSHNDSIGEPEHDLSLLAESRAVLRDILKFMKNHDPDHVKAMVHSTQGSAKNGD